ncbi:MAG: cytochrome-c peroxidase [Saprospiraceae bacterium]|nr:cytochrome-c peroxidase [Saprospiraceae bacterium]
MIRNLLLLTSLCLIISCAKDPEDHGADADAQLEQLLKEASPSNALEFFAMPSSDNFMRIPQDPLNPLSADKVALGKALYHETGLAVLPKYTEGEYAYSCASCHHASAGFQAGVRQGIGEGGMGFGYAGEARLPNPNYHLDSLDVQPIRTPTAMNGAYQKVMLWNGQFGATGPNAGTERSWTADTPKETNHLGYEGLEIQAIAGLKVHRLGFKKVVTENEEYQAMFAAAFPDVPAEEHFTRENAGLAIAAYERTMLANQAPFQRWLAGDRNAMTPTQKEGAMLFFGKAKCVSCHTGPALNTMEFHALGMPDLLGPGIYGSSESTPAHLGRADFTGNPADEHKFKVPQLYNLSDSKFYGHGGSFRSVREVVEYKNAAIPAKIEVLHSQLAAGFRPLFLEEHEIDLLVEFIEQGLYDPELNRYVPSSLPTGACFPNADLQSKSDLGCD